MIKSDDFYQAFEAGADSVGLPDGLVRIKGKVPKYRAQTPAGKLTIWFKVNAKASAIPYNPGQFWPIIDLVAPRGKARGAQGHAAGTASPEADGGGVDTLVSWYQYTDAEMNGQILAMQRKVFDKVAAQADFDAEMWRKSRDLWLMLNRDSYTQELMAGFPHTSLHYLDESDAREWGALLAAQLAIWFARYQAKPQTLDEFLRTSGA